MKLTDIKSPIRLVMKANLGNFVFKAIIDDKMAIEIIDYLGRIQTLIEKARKTKLSSTPNNKSK